MKNRTGRGYFFFNTAKHETMRYVKARMCYIELEVNTNATENVEVQNVKDLPKMIESLVKLSEMVSMGTQNPKENGECETAVCGKFNLEICLKNFCEECTQRFSLFFFEGSKRIRSNTTITVFMVPFFLMPAQPVQDPDHLSTQVADTNSSAAPWKICGQRLHHRVRQGE